MAKFGVYYFLFFIPSVTRRPLTYGISDIMELVRCLIWFGLMAYQPLWVI